MHKGVILILKAENRKEIEERINEFMEPYGDSRVWDWFQIGGRWSGILDGYEPDKDPKNIVTCDLCQGTGKHKDMKIENGCNGCDGTGKHPKWPSERGDYEGDILPLIDCLEKVKEFKGDLEAQIAEEEKHAEEYKAKGNKSMQGYCLKNAAEMLGEEFCFEANVYNIESCDYSIPEDTKGFWAVIVDMHN